VRALAERGRRDAAARTLAMLSPLSHTDTPERRDVYGLEPYVIAADVYGEPPHVRRGGWSWYTGSAGWMMRVALESLLGVRVEHGELVVAPRIPDAWPACAVEWRVPGHDTTLAIEIANPTGRAARVIAAELDDAPLAPTAGAVRVPLPHDGGAHTLRITLGA